MSLEFLEGRLHLSAVLKSDGHLIITGTNGADRVVITELNGKIEVHEWAKVTSFNQASVAKIRVSLWDGNDIFAAGALVRPLFVLGGAGNDRLTTGRTNDTVHGGDGDDQIVTGPGNDSVLGGAGNDYVAAGYGNDTLHGGAGNDNLGGTYDNDAVYGNDGDDTVSGGSGADLISGGNGTETLDYSASTTGVWIAADRQPGDANEGDNIYGDIELIVGSAYGDYLQGGSGRVTLVGGGGNDTLVGGTGGAYMDGGAGDDSLRGTAASDVFIGGVGNDLVDYGSRTENLILRLDGYSASGRAGENDVIHPDFETINAGSGNDHIYGSDLPEVIYANAGNDTIDGGWGNDTIWGGDGSDTGDYSSRTMLQQLRIGIGTGIPGEQDIPHEDIETLIGGAGNDWIEGGYASNLLIGNGGDDTLIGQEGNDTLIGGDGADLLGFDTAGGPQPIVADVGDDLLYGYIIGNNEDGDVDRFTDTFGTNTRHSGAGDVLS